jgi:hypothetical protein
MVAVLHYTFKISAFFVSALAIYLGYHLFILGVTGQATLVVHAETLQGQLINGSPGLFFAVGGILTAITAIRKGLKEPQN